MPKRSLVFLLDQHYYNDHDGNGKKMKTRMDQLYDSWLSKKSYEFNRNLHEMKPLHSRWMDDDARLLGYDFQFLWQLHQAGKLNLARSVGHAFSNSHSNIGIFLHYLLFLAMGSFDNCQNMYHERAQKALNARLTTPRIWSTVLHHIERSTGWLDLTSFLLSQCRQMFLQTSDGAEELFQRIISHLAPALWLQMIPKLILMNTESRPPQLTENTPSALTQAQLLSRIKRITDAYPDTKSVLLQTTGQHFVALALKDFKASVLRIGLALVESLSSSEEEYRIWFTTQFQVLVPSKKQVDLFCTVLAEESKTTPLGILRIQLKVLRTYPNASTIRPFIVEAKHRLADAVLLNQKSPASFEQSQIQNSVVKDHRRDPTAAAVAAIFVQEIVDEYQVSKPEMSKTMKEMKLFQRQKWEKQFKPALLNSCSLSSCVTKPQILARAELVKALFLQHEISAEKFQAFVTQLETSYGVESVVDNMPSSSSSSSLKNEIIVDHGDERQEFQAHMCRWLERVLRHHFGSTLLLPMIIFIESLDTDVLPNNHSFYRRLSEDQIAQTLLRCSVQIFGLFTTRRRSDSRSCGSHDMHWVVSTFLYPFLHEKHDDDTEERDRLAKHLAKNIESLMCEKWSDLHFMQLHSFAQVLVCCGPVWDFHHKASHFCCAHRITSLAQLKVWSVFLIQYCKISIVHQVIVEEWAEPHLTILQFLDWIEFRVQDSTTIIDDESSSDPQRWTLILREYQTLRPVLVSKSKLTRMSIHTFLQFEDLYRSSLFSCPSSSSSSSSLTRHEASFLFPFESSSSSSPFGSLDVCLAIARTYVSSVKDSQPTLTSSVLLDWFRNVLVQVEECSRDTIDAFDRQLFVDLISMANDSQEEHRPHHLSKSISILYEFEKHFYSLKNDDDDDVPNLPPGDLFDANVVRQFSPWPWTQQTKETRSDVHHLVYLVFLRLAPPPQKKKENHHHHRVDYSSSEWINDMISRWSTFPGLLSHVIQHWSSPDSIFISQQIKDELVVPGIIPLERFSDCHSVLSHWCELVREIYIRSTYVSEIVLTLENFARLLFASCVYPPPDRLKRLVHHVCRHVSNNNLAAHSKYREFIHVILSMARAHFHEHIVVVGLAPDSSSSLGHHEGSRMILVSALVLETDTSMRNDRPWETRAPLDIDRHDESSCHELYWRLVWYRLSHEARIQYPEIIGHFSQQQHHAELENQIIDSLCLSRERT